MAHFYTYIDPAEIEAQFIKKAGDDDEDEKRQLQKAEFMMDKKQPTESWDEKDKGKKTKM